MFVTCFYPMPRKQGGDYMCFVTSSTLTGSRQVVDE